MIDTCQDVLEREAKSGRGALDEKSTRIFHIYRFLSDFENGGLSGFLYNLSLGWDDLRELQTMADRLNHPELATALAEVLEIVRRGPEDHRGTWSEWLQFADPTDRLTSLDQTIFDHYGSLWDDLEAMASGD